MRPFPFSRLFVGTFVLLSIALTAPGAPAELVSIRPRQPTQQGASSSAGVSGEGRFVVFASLAKFDAQDTNERPDVFVKDLRTKSLRRISDERGGNLPVISANGRFVVFRALDDFPKLRLVDLEGDPTPRTVSIPFLGKSFRVADSPAISPDGKFIGFSFRPIPGFNANTDPQLVVLDASDPDPLNAGASITSNFLLATLGRAAMSRDGNTFFLETDDQVLPADTNTDTDIYRATRGSDFVVRVSATDGGLPEVQGARDPVLTAAGDALFFISGRQLRASDTDGRATIYRSTSADGFATPNPILTAVRPLSLHPQATSDGSFLVFTGVPSDGKARVYLLRLSDGALRALGPNGPGIANAPAISADNGLIVFSSEMPLAGSDDNGAPDVFAVFNPFAGARRTAPVVTLTAPADGSEIAESVVNLSANASAPGGIFFTALEVDGVEVARASGGLVQRSLFLARGFHRIRAVALDAANVPGRSEAVEVTVRPGANIVGITGASDLTRTVLRDGTTSFSAKLRVDNTFASARGPLQVVLAERPATATWEFFGDEDQVPEQAERILTVIDVPSLAANSFTEADIASVASAPQVIGDGFQGLGWTITARLREQVGGNFFDRGTITLFEVRPRLSDDTPGPNGGIPVLAPNTNAPPFNPTVLQGLTIDGPAQMAEGTSATYSATLNFSNGNQPGTPAWRVVNGGGLASISEAGVLTVREVSSARTIGVRATFGAVSQTRSVRVTPVSPVVTVRASTSLAAEPAQPGSFRILRTPVRSTPLTVAYQIDGTATAGQDFTAVSGTVTIDGGAAAATVVVNPLDDALIEGREKVRLTVLPSGDYRRGQARSAIVTIDDNEPPRPDAIVQAPAAAPVGEFEIGSDSAQQQALVRRRVNQRAVFQCRFVNRTAAARDFTISGGSDFLGFTVRYFSAGNDVTAAVVNGAFNVNAVPPGDTVSLEVRITPTTQTPRGGLLRCPILLQSGGDSDVVEAAVRRVR